MNLEITIGDKEINTIMMFKTFDCTELQHRFKLNSSPPLFFIKLSNTSLDLDNYIKENHKLSFNLRSLIYENKPKIKNKLTM